jgi:hypothetical protein
MEDHMQTAPASPDAEPASTLLALLRGADDQAALINPAYADPRSSRLTSTTCGRAARIPQQNHVHRPNSERNRLINP